MKIPNTIIHPIIQNFQEPECAEIWRNESILICINFFLPPTEKS